MAQTYDAIASYTFGSAASSYTFSSIAASWTDLILVLSGRTATAGASDSYLLTLNGDNGNNYSRTRILGTGSAASSASRSAANIDFEGLSGGSSSSTFYTAIVNLQNYSNSTTYKTLLIRGSDPANYIEATVGLWRSTSAITSITLATSSASNFSVGTTMSLYGVKSA
jgi:hypothetical protein